MATLELRSVEKRFGEVVVIPPIDLSIADGEFVVFVGPSGCGKSTLLRLVAGLEEVSAGAVVIDDADVSSVPASDRGVAMVFQSYALYPHMSVRENLAFGLENVRMPKAEIAQRVGDAARLLQIEPLLQRRPKELSGGQRQRVAIGRAITRDPKIFLFDEPLSNLDAELRVQMRIEITKLHERLGATMIYVTHDQIEAMTMADKIVVLRSGRIEQVGAPLDLYNAPANRFVAGFIGSPRMNFVDGVAEAVDEGSVTFKADGLDPVRIERGTPDIRSGEPIALGVRPEDVEVSTDGTGWPAHVSVTEQYGNASYLHCLLPNDVPMLVHEPGQSVVRSGHDLHLRPRSAACHLFDADGRSIGRRPTSALDLGTDRRDRPEILRTAPETR